MLAATTTMTLQLPLELASTRTGISTHQTDKPHLITIDAQGLLQWEENRVDTNELRSRLDAVQASSPDDVVGVACDRQTPFEFTADVLAAIAEAKLSARLITEESSQP